MFSFFFYCYSNLNIASYCIDQDGSSLLFYWCFSSFLGGCMVHCCWNSIFIWLWNLNQNYCTHLILKQFIYLLGGLRLFLLSHECDHSFVNLKFLLFGERSVSSWMITQWLVWYIIINIPCKLVMDWITIILFGCIYIFFLSAIVRI